MDYLTLETPIGLIMLTAKSERLCEVSLAGSFSYKQSPSALLEKAARELDEYFAGRRFAFDIPLLTEGSGFQKAVWAQTAKIGYGRTASYKDIAERMSTKAYRAVGQALSANRLPFFIPCHRIVAADGSAGGFAWGSAKKLFLLRLEQNGIKGRL